jgi:hypothetical protein
LISAIGEVIASIPKDELVRVYAKWIKGFRWVITHRGECCHKCIKEQPTICHFERDRNVPCTFGPPRHIAWTEFPTAETGTKEQGQIFFAFSISHFE